MIPKSDDKDAYVWPSPRLIAGDIAACMKALFDQSGLFTELWLGLNHDFATSVAYAFGPQDDASTNHPVYRHKNWYIVPALRFARILHTAIFKRLRDLLARLNGIDPTIMRRLGFWLRHVEAATCPAFNITTSPEVADSASASGGETLRQGMANLRRDLARSRFQLHIARQPEHAFELGRDLAATPGQIVFANELIELIRYTPIAKNTGRVPLLIVPPCINRYYVLDLRPENSFAAWCTAQGIDLFMISWRPTNPQGPGFDFSDYVTTGIEPACQYVEASSESGEFDLLGYCIGGTMSASFAGWRAAMGHPQPRRLTLLATLLDFSDPGDLGVFISADQLDDLEDHLQRCGVLSGNLLRRSFELLQPESLIWKMALQRYGLGRPPKAHDLMFWSDDTPDLPGPMMINYLRECYLENKLIQTGKLQIKGTGIDLHKVTSKALMVATQMDHIAPWQSVLAGARHLPGLEQFILTSGGHISGIVNPPTSDRRRYQVMKTGPKPVNDDWQQGSWWPHWHRWLSQDDEP